ncbi:ZKSCAN4 protein [Spatholobus suberectus]|nr:ZKSCAN4 protein [Spatholobus suberectus]
MSPTTIAAVAALATTHTTAVQERRLRHSESPEHRNPRHANGTPNDNALPKKFGGRNGAYLDRDGGDWQRSDSESDEELKGLSHEEYRRLKRQRMRKSLKHCIWNVSPSPPRRDNEDPEDYNKPGAISDRGDVADKEVKPRGKSESESDSEKSASSESDDSRSRKKRRKSSAGSSRRSYSDSESETESGEDDRSRRKSRRNRRRSNRNGKKRRYSDSEESEESESDDSDSGGRKRKKRASSSSSSSRSRSKRSRRRTKRSCETESESSYSEEENGSGSGSGDAKSKAAVDEVKKTEINAEAIKLKELFESQKKPGLDNDPSVGPMPLPRAEGHISYGGALRPGEGDAIAQYVQQGKRIPRRGEVGLSAEEIEKFEALVM